MHIASYPPFPFTTKNLYKSKCCLSPSNGEKGKKQLGIDLAEELNKKLVEMASDLVIWASNNVITIFYKTPSSSKNRPTMDFEFKPYKQLIMP